MSKLNRVYHQSQPPNVNLSSGILIENLVKGYDERECKYECQACGARFRTASLLKSHKESFHNGERIYKCKLCPKDYLKQKHLGEHMLSHKPNFKHKCAVCNKLFPNRRGLDQHLRSHTGEKPFKCSTCAKSYSTKAGAIAHERAHRNVPFLCIMCEKSYPTNCQLLNHIYSHTRERPYSCSTCEKSFPSNTQRRNHVNSVHKKVKPYTCEICGRRCTSTSSFKIHVRRHLGEKSHQCNICDKKFVTRRELKFHENSFQCPHCATKLCSSTQLKDHITKFHSGEGRQYVCPCGAKFPKKYLLESHLAGFHHGERIYKCEICPKTYTNEDNLSRHKFTHLNKRELKCDLCLKAFMFKDQLVKHLRTHTGEKPFSCSICNRRFGCQADVKSHERVHQDVGDEFACIFCGNELRSQNLLNNHILGHIKENIWECNICSKTFVTAYRLRDHVKKIHNNMNSTTPVSCIMCEKTFSTNGTLKIHLQCHTRERPLSCFQCEKTFPGYGGALQRHVERAHTKIKLHYCELCGNGFVNSSSLQEHLRRHLGEKLFGCKLCNKRFFRASELKRHEVSHQCPQCPEKLANATNLEDHIGKYHAEEGPLYECPCGAKFKNPYLLKHHKDSLHTGEKIYKCDICPKTYYWENLLRRHKLTHLNKREFKCVVCNKLFACKSNLDNHMRIHTGEKPFSCSVCLRRFGSKLHAKRHERTHQEVGNEFACVFCERQLRKKRFLDSHILLHIKEKSFACSLCDKSYVINDRLREHVKLAHNKKTQQGLEGMEWE
ncbi:unnamed protein product [Orchesella dallaii]|uniref:C2H2-type domain-containing protein n=1 Tax=Orchesella dallaii TaxID=48710 RepID=A0ABP1QCZ0_9HEXA